MPQAGDDEPVQLFRLGTRSSAVGLYFGYNAGMFIGGLYQGGVMLSRGGLLAVLLTLSGCWRTTPSSSRFGRMLVQDDGAALADAPFQSAGATKTALFPGSAGTWPRIVDTSGDTLVDLEQFKVTITKDPAREGCQVVLEFWAKCNGWAPKVTGQPVNNHQRQDFDVFLKNTLTGTTDPALTLEGVSGGFDCTLKVQTNYAYYAPQLDCLERAGFAHVQLPTAPWEYFRCH